MPRNAKWRTTAMDSSRIVREGRVDSGIRIERADSREERETSTRMR